MDTPDDFAESHPHPETPEDPEQALRASGWPLSGHVDPVLAALRT